MVAFRGFRAWMPPPALASQIADPPYDVVSEAEARALIEGRPHAFLRLTRPELELPPGAGPAAQHVQARAVLERMIAQGVLLQREESELHAYRIEDRGHVQTGLVGLASARDHAEGRIVRHELTRVDKEEERTAHVEAVGAHDEPVLLCWRESPALAAALEEATRGIPRFDFTAPDGVRHTAWGLGAALSARLEQGLAGVERLYIADGHHRTAAATRAFERGTAPDGFLAVAFPDSQLRVLAYHRLLTSLGDWSPAALRTRLALDFEVSAVDRERVLSTGRFGLYLEGRWWALTERAGAPAGLDVTRLQEAVLGPLFGVEDPRTDPRLGFVGGAEGLEGLARHVDDGRAVAAFALHPTPLQQLFDIADAGGIMPPKSTWFAPKPRSGLFVHRFR